MSEARALGPQVTHPEDMATVVTDTRSLISTLRVTDAPAEVLERAAALIREATALLAPHGVEGTPTQTALRFEHADPAAFASGDAARFFPYSPVVGPLSPIAPPLTFAFDGARLRGAGQLSPVYAGPPGMVHGGIVALVFDELLGAVNACLGLGAFTGTLTVRYERPTPLATDLELESWVDRTEGRKVFTVGTISAGGEVTARAEGVFLRVELGAAATG
jgi:acyl-coenzyme A thioesterase PaaI-like protein